MKKILKSKMLRRIIVAVLVVGLMINMEGIQGLGKLTVYAGFSFPDKMTPNQTINLVTESSSYSLVVVFCDTEEAAQNALNVAETARAYVDIGAYGDVHSGTTITAPSTDGSNNSVLTWKKKGSLDAQLYSGGTYDVAAYYADEVTVEKKTYYMYCEYGVDANNLYDDYFDWSDSYNFAEDMRGDVKITDFSTSPNTIGGYAVSRWKEIGTKSAVSSNIAVYQAVFKGGYNCKPGEDVDAEDYKKTKEFSLDEPSSGDSIALPTAAVAGFSRTGYSLAGWSEEPDGGDYLAPGSDHELYPGEIRNYYAVWIPKTEVILTVTVDEPVYDGDDIATKISVQKTPTAATGTPILEYKTKGAEDSTYSTTVPTAPGEYTVRAALEESDDYAAAVSDPVNFEILNSTVNVSVTYKPNGGTGNNVTQNKVVSLVEGVGEITLLSSADFKRNGYTLTGWKNSSGSKFDLGAKYEIEQGVSEIVFDAVWTEKTKGTVDIDLKKPVYVGTEIKYDIEKNSKGDVTVEYKKKGDKDEKYSKKVPTEPGKYTVRATLEETDEYTAAEDTVDFDITYLTAPDNPYSYQEVKNSAGTVTDVNVIPADGYSISTSADADFVSAISYTAAKAAGGSVYLKRDSDKAVTEAVKLKDYHLEDTIKLTVPAKIYYGTELKVTASSLSPAEMTIEYRKASAPDNAYTTTVPTTPGDYVVRFSAPASGLYLAVNETKNFSIVYLEAPSDKAYLDGKKGNGGWFKSDVEIKAPSGYLISTTLGTGYTDSIDWNDKIKKLYYQRDDGAMTDAVDFDPSAKIDMKAPVAKFDSSLGIKDPSGTVKVTMDNLTFTLEDENLEKVTVNKTPYDVSNGKCVITLDAGSDTESWTVVATDKAGNSYTFTIELSPQWMSNNTMPAGRTVTLKSNVPYSFEDSGDWMVEIEGKVDNTVYAGGNKFYVKGNMECRFVKK